MRLARWRSVVPRAPEKISPSWLTRIVRSKEPDCAAVQSFRWEQIGDGQLGLNVRLNLGYKDDGPCGPLSLFCKFPASDRASRATALALGNYRTEVNFYRALENRHKGWKIPACWFACFDSKSGDFVVVLEELSRCYPGDPLRGLSLYEAAAALKTIAEIHAATWERKNEDWLPKLPQPSRERVAQQAEFFAGAAAEFLARYESALTPPAPRLIREFVPRFAEWVSLQKPPFALVHGEYRPDNLLFDNSKPRRPVAWVVDWQTAHWGPPAIDVAYLIGGGLRIQARQQWESRLLAMYRHFLESYLGHFIYLPPLWESYRLASFFGVAMVVVAAVLVKRTERSDEIFLTLLSRHVQHVLDVDGFAALSPPRPADLHS